MNRSGGTVMVSPGRFSCPGCGSWRRGGYCTWLRFPERGQAPRSSLPPPWLLRGRFTRRPGIASPSLTGPPQSRRGVSGGHLGVAGEEDL